MEWSPVICDRFWDERDAAAALVVQKLQDEQPENFL